MGQPQRRIIITRPQPEADDWVAQLRQRGWAAEALPLIDIAAADSPAHQAARMDARQHWARYGALMLVSTNAARFFLDPALVQALAGQPRSASATRLWCPGPGTARAAQALGIPSALIDQPATDAPQFDSESLWAEVGPQATAMAASGRRVLVVRGASAGTAIDQLVTGSGREWLARQLQEAGIGVDFVGVYQRQAPAWTAAQLALATQALADGSIWLFSSSEAVMHLRNRFGAAALAPAQALATHARIAQATRAAGFVHIQQCRPSLEDVVASLESAL
ncbi:uroporphyrinogen-III synthase [Comamonas sediminis]|uniref:uroporphyrinogen-III synthase n=1 Tax=Comamonas TaxID=283 RepID=UPI0028A0237C|nr:uroporphyrinogen-III synthase [Comamonas sp.]